MAYVHTCLLGCSRTAACTVKVLKLCARQHRHSDVIFVARFLVTTQSKLLIVYATVHFKLFFPTV